MVARLPACRLVCMCVLDVFVYVVCYSTRWLLVYLRSELRVCVLACVFARLFDIVFACLCLLSLRFVGWVFDCLIGYRFVCPEMCLSVCLRVCLRVRFFVAFVCRLFG